MTVLSGTQPATVGALLREWRRRRRLSQLELSLKADVSARHLSFVETGRSTPSRDMVLQLADRLDLPLRERNRMLLAAGYAPAYPETPLQAPVMRAVRDAVRQVLTGHEPYPAVVVDRYWNIVDANAALGLMTSRVSPALLTPPHANVLRASLHPDGLAPHIVNLGEWRAHLLHRLHRQVSFSGDPRLAELAEELHGYPCDQPEPDLDAPGPGRIMVPLRVRTDLGEVTFFSTVATFGTPLDITVEELCIESFYPGDAFTADALRNPVGRPPVRP
ncbi:helix-turn-helix transcriptional regulator [Actinoplanes sp. NEAU-A12]|uniref:Helix-turn-helix transcriptional regulator n=1 Tax=Actinoplanes sandaracinus TaxID=3045177 RepID=A0ABT6WX16_9ACTN|nr:helix-turn-helix transcriptional regulator [Actinoplanes sandaracinus]MDI6104254.1 helix-turn-helix transcriptional regulator [Actinoplanes sandaracinus]